MQRQTKRNANGMQRMYPLPRSSAEAFDILGLPHDATAAEIRSEYTYLRERLHPHMRQVNIITGIGLPLSEAQYRARYRPIERAYTLLLPDEYRASQRARSKCCTRPGSKWRRPM
jgi:DnaJ-class molecular chaperone